MALAVVVVVCATASADDLARDLGPLRHMGIATAFNVFLAGCALALPTMALWARLLQSGLGAVVAIAAVVTLLGYATGDANAGQWRLLLVSLPGSTELLAWPGRLSLPAALALVAAGLALAAAPFVRRRAAIVAAHVLWGVVAFVGLFGITTHATGLAALYQLSPQVAILGWPAGTALLAIAAGIALRCSREAWFVDFYRDRQERRVFVATLALMLVLLTAAWSVGVGMLVNESVRSIERTMTDTLRTDAAVLEDVIWEARVEVAEALALSRLGEILAAPAGGDRAAAVLGEAERIVELSRHTGFSHVRIMSADGDLVTATGAASHAAAGRIPLRQPAESTLLWNGRLTLFSRHGIHHEGRLVGYGEAEVPLVRAEVKIAAFQQGAGGSRRVAACGRSAGETLCLEAPGGNRPRAQRRPGGVDERGRVEAAIAGLSGVSVIQDAERGSVAIAYGPVGKTGLAMLEEVHTAELLAPLQGQLRSAVLVLLVLGVGGALLVYWQVAPTVRGLVRLRSEMAAVLDNVPAGIVTLDAQARILEANPAAEAMFGRATLAGATLGTLMPGARGIDDQDFRERVMTGSPALGSTREVRGRRGDGSEFPLEVRVGRYRSDGERRFIGILLDASERKLAEEKLMRWARVFEHAGWGVLVWAADRFEIELMNPAFARMHGYSVEEAMGLPVTHFLAEDARRELPRIVEEMQRRGHVRYELLSRHKDGSVFPILVDATSVADDSGRELYRVVNVQDISGLKLAAEALGRSEALLRKVLDTLPVGVWVTDRNGKIIMGNRAGQAIWGGARYVGIGEYGEYKGWWADTGKRIAPEEWGLARAVTRSETSLGEVVNIQSFDGKFKTVLSSAVPLLGEGGEIEGAILVQEDITERKAIEQDLLRSRERLRELAAYHDAVREEERKRIAMEVHDELGQLLTALKMEISLLRMRLDDNADLSARIGQMRELVEKTIAMVRNVATHLRPAALNLGLVPALEWLAQDFTLRTGVPCHLEMAGGEVQLPDAHATALFRIVQESLTNAARHAGASQVVVRLDRGEDSLRLEIQDDGCGFDPEVVSRAHSFGLLGIRERVLILGGSVDFDSGPGRDTTIVIAIPLDDRASGGM